LQADIQIPSLVNYAALCKLAMADSIIFATARDQDATLWTQDAHFKGMDGVKYIEKKS
jgi:predicted nucleic acid-binding protein